MIILLIMMMMKPYKIFSFFTSASRLHDVDVLLSNTADVNNITIASFRPCYFRQGIVSAVETWACRARYARYVMIAFISTPHNSGLVLCEVQIFGRKASPEGKTFPFLYNGFASLSFKGG